MAFEKSTQKVQLLNDFAELRKSLDALGPIPNGIEIYDYAVRFFNIIVKFQDKPGDFSVLKNAKNAKSLSVFTDHLMNAGRDPYGWVRAEKGKEVTLDNLYLGDIAGIWTGKASKFKASKDKEVQEKIQGQLRNFIKSHREPMMALCNEILHDTKKPNNILFRIFGSKQKAM